MSVLDKNTSPAYVLGLINSKLLFWYLKKISNVFRGGWITCTKQYIGQIPIRNIDFSNISEKSAYNRIVRLVEEILKLHEEKRSLDPGRHFDEIRDVEKRIAQVDAKIDRSVYELYGLTEEEIKIVEYE